MTELQLSSFKKQVKEFYEALLPLFDLWDDDNKHTLLRVLLQNLQFRGKDTVGYSFEDELKRSEDILKTIKSLAQYENYHLFNYVYSELDMIRTGILMSEEI